MPNKWVDKPDYFGPDRRRRPGPKRWSERRRHNESQDLPPLGALLRRLRVQMSGLRTPDERRHALQLLSAAIGEAQRQGLRDCVGALQDADKVLRQGGQSAASLADGKLVDAMNALALERGPRDA
ncbi:MAG: hypothetical protein K2P58_05310 [Hyphomonadaceae bacterium]|nr:hypothetical protein [Hyphomonadaceae bacterium]